MRSTAGNVSPTFSLNWQRESDLIRESKDQFRASLNRHIDKLIEEEEGFGEHEVWRGQEANTHFYAHRYAASLLRELKAWLETGS